MCNCFLLSSMDRHQGLTKPTVCCQGRNKTNVIIMGCVAMQEIHQARKSEHALGIFHYSSCHETPKDN